MSLRRSRSPLPPKAPGSLWFESAESGREGRRPPAFLGGAALQGEAAASLSRWRGRGSGSGSEKTKPAKPPAAFLSSPEQGPEPGVLPPSLEHSSNSLITGKLTGGGGRGKGAAEIEEQLLLVRLGTPK